MKTAPVFITALLLLTGVFADSQTAAASSPGSIVGVWEFQVHLFDCQTGATQARLRATSLFNADGTMLDTNVAPPSSRGPAFGVWRYDASSQTYEVTMRLNRYNLDGSFAGVAEVQRTLRLADGDNSTGEIRGQLYGADEQPAAPPGCGSEVGTRVL